MEKSSKQTITEEFDSAGLLVKKIVTVGNDQQSSIELNYDRKGVPALKLKVYEDVPELMDEKLKTYIEIGKKHLNHIPTQ